MKDYYAILGVSKDASIDEIKSAHKKLVRKYHPDSSGSEANVDLFKEVQEAFEILSNQDKRIQYDRMVELGGLNPGLGDIFHGPSWNGGNIPQEGDDINIMVSVDIKDLFHEHVKEITFDRNDYCLKCSGSGLKKNRNKTTCKKCKGSGKVRSGNSFIQVIHTCDACLGDGVKVNKEDACDGCLGSGTTINSVTLSLKIPKGMPQGARRLFLREQSHVGANGGPRGTVYVAIHHPPGEFERFQARQQDLFHRAEIPYWKAVLGGKHTIEHPTGKMTIDVPPGSTVNDKMECVKGAGIPVFSRDTMGDLYVRFVVKIPTNLDAKEREIVNQMRRHDEEKYQKESD